MRTLRTLSLSVAALVLCALSWASTIVYTFKVVDDSGAPLPGATLTQNTVKSLTAVTLGNAVAGLTLTVVDLGNGDYGLPYDPEGTNGELIVNFTASKAGSTLTGQNASISINLTKDSSRALNADVATSTRLASAGYTAPPALPSAYPLAPNDEAVLTYLFNMVDANGGTPRYKATSLALAPAGAGGASVDPFGLPRTGQTYAPTTWGGWFNAQLAAPYAGLTNAEIASIWAAPSRTLTGVVQIDQTQALSPAQMLTDTVGGGLWGGASALRKVVIAGSTLTIYQADGVTVLKAFTLTPAPTAGSKQ